MQAPHPSASFKNGFTAVEVTVTVVLTLILGAIVAKPLTGYLQRIKLQNAAEGLKHQILNARARAMANSTVHCGMAFRANASASDSAFSFLERSSPANNTYNPGTDALYLVPMVYPIVEKIQLSIPTGYPTSFVFRGDGSANSSPKVILTLGAMQDTIDVLASTGRVKVK